MRRACGMSGEDQPDPMAGDYSKLITDPNDFYPFCILSQEVYNNNSLGCEKFRTLDNSSGQL